ncbi:unnamed protein product [Miscanthus lutarioriparius]|uniref:Uncharacterized protein n=1 Tax=Miscanthus lutarioriparius TaxID=422564 RepID=A0A811QAM6_9POAL|nr:unnamed protein product [Miscanthus lutarioriparius]
MGDFLGHVLPGTLLLAVGLWRVWASVARFAADPPTAFRVRAWNPVPAVPARLLELHAASAASTPLAPTHASSAAAQERAEQLVEFQLFGIVFLAFLYVLGCFAVAAARYGNNLEMTTVHDQRVAVPTGPSLGLGASELRFGLEF